MIDCRELKTKLIGGLRRMFSRKVVWIVVVLLSIFGVIWCVNAFLDMRSEVITLREVLKQKDEEIRQRDMMIEDLSKRLVDLERKRREIEKELVALKTRRISIKRPETDEELLERFRRLGYNAVEICK